MIDVALQLRVADRQRHFDLDIAFASDAPVVALYGPSGAGKSLTFQAMAGLLPATAGRVQIGDRVLYDSARGIDVPAPERQLGVLFQQYALFPHLSVRQNVAFGLTSWRRKLSADAAARVDALLESFGLAALTASRPASLSGGQQQRVALARALACNPRALLLDEPFAALNPQLRQQLRTELAQVRQRWQVPMLMITHDIEDVLALANVALLIDGGRVVREVDLDRVQSREQGRDQGREQGRAVSRDAGREAALEAARDALLPPEARRPPRPHEDALRTMLGAGPQAAGGGSS